MRIATTIPASGLAMLLLSGCETTTETVDWQAPEKVLFQDGFGSNGYNWFIGAKPDAYDFEITDGEYFLRSLNDSGILVSKAIPIPENGDFVVRVSLHSYGAEKDLGYGFCWGGADADHRFCFFASRDRQYTLFKRGPGGIREYIPWTPSPAVDADRNVLEIRKQGTVLRYGVNGKETGAIPYEPFFGSRLYFAGDGIQDFAVDAVTVLGP